MRILAPLPPDSQPAACADPDMWPLVDAAAARPGGEEAKQMSKSLCSRCPVIAHCFRWAMTHPEYGIWATTSPIARTKQGAPSISQALDGAL